MARIENNSAFPFPLSLEELGLYNLLIRVHDRQELTDPLLRHALVQKGLLVDDKPARLTRQGIAELQGLLDRFVAAGISEVSAA
jgi:hypothetical protein